MEYITYSVDFELVGLRDADLYAQQLREHGRLVSRQGGWRWHVREREVASEGDRLRLHIRLMEQLSHPNDRHTHAGRPDATCAQEALDYVRERLESVATWRTAAATSARVLGVARIRSRIALEYQAAA